MPEDALELVRLRNNFYRDNYRRLVMALLILLALNAALVGIIVYQYSTRPEPRYFATSADGKITPIYALDIPVVSASALLQWANQAAVAAFSYNFANYRQALQDASEYFTPEGWKDFQAALESSNNLNAVITKKLVVSAVATGAPGYHRPRRHLWTLLLESANPTVSKLPKCEHKLSATAFTGHFISHSCFNTLCS